MPADHPLAAVDPKTGYTYNDKLRAIHDLYGHAVHGWQFGERGEENAWITHSQMFSRQAIPALTSETKGQNNWVNFGPHMRRADGTLIKKGEEGWLDRPQRPFAEQKAGLLPRRYHYRIDAPLSFISPNTLNIPGVTEAQRQFKSDIHNRFIDQAHTLADDMGMNVVVESALGSWKGGAENSIAIRYPFGADPDLVKYYEANLGRLGYQYATARFTPDVNGKDTLHQFWVQGANADASKIASLLLGNSIENSTIIPAEDGYIVTLIDPNDGLRESVRNLKNELGVKSVENNRGAAEFPGNYTDRDAAGRDFQSAIEEIERRRPSLRRLRRGFESRPGYNLLHRAIREAQELVPAEPAPVSGPGTLEEIKKETKRLQGPRGSTVPLMRSVLLPRYKMIEDIAAHLEDNTRKTLDQLYPGGTTAEHRAMVNRAVRIAKDELKYQLAQENSGADWYKDDIRGPANSLMSEMKLLHPELSDPVNERMFLLHVAATSPGKTAAFDNVNVAEQAYNLYKKKGEIPLRQEDGTPWGAYGHAPLKTAQGLLRYFDGDVGKAMEWMLTKHPLKEVENVKARSGYSRDTVKNALPPDYDPDAVYGAYILGEKVGPFFMNLNGISTELTVDRWFMRTWNRLMGTLINSEGKLQDVPRGKNERAAMVDAIDKLGKEFGLETSQVQAALWYYEQGLYSRLGQRGTFGGTYASAAKDVFNLRSEGFTSQGERDAAQRDDALRGSAGGGAGPPAEGVRPEDTESEGAGSTGELFGDTSFDFGEPKVIPIQEAKRIAERQKPREKLAASRKDRSQ